MSAGNAGCATVLPGLRVSRTRPSGRQSGFVPVMPPDRALRAPGGEAATVSYRDRATASGYPGRDGRCSDPHGRHALVVAGKGWVEMVCRAVVSVTSEGRHTISGRCRTHGDDASTPAVSGTVGHPIAATATSPRPASTARIIAAMASLP